jgi:membrane-associated protease RseP (regulator of RpoE activity)
MIRRTPLAAAIAAMSITALRAASAQTLPPPDEAVPDAPTPRAATEFIPGYLGVHTDDRKDAGVGARILDVTPGSPAALAGLREKDLVTGVDGRAIHSSDDLLSALQPLAAGSIVALEVVRLGKVQNIQVTLGGRPAVVEPTPLAAPGAYIPAAAPRPLLGVRTLPVNESDRVRLGLPTTRGARVVARVPGSPAVQVDIPIDAVITSINGEAIDSPSQLSETLARAGAGGRIEITYFAAGQLVRTRVTLGEAPAAAQETPPPGTAVVRTPAVAPAPRPAIVVPGTRATIADIPRPPIPGGTGLPGSAEYPERVDTQVPAPAAPAPKAAVPVQVAPPVQTDVQRLDALEQRMRELEKLVQELNEKIGRQR